jgi:glycosyltransferase involved in cell wall biosynthesis
LGLGLIQANTLGGPRISVLLAVYNGVSYLPALFDSLLAQQYLPSEIVVCDDGSTDDSLFVISAYQEKTSVPILIHRNAANLGYRNNFWQGMRLCSGDYIAFCDQDDVWLESKLEKIQCAIQAHNSPSMLFSDCTVVNAQLLPLNITGLAYSGISPERKQHLLEGRLFEVLLRHPCVTGMTMVCRRDVLMRLPQPNNDIPHDYLISTVLSAQCDYVFLDESLVLYRQHASNLIGMQAKKKVPVYRWGDPLKPDEWNLDMHSKLQLLHYVRSAQHVMNKQNTAIALQLQQCIVFFEHRLARRFVLRALCRPRAVPVVLRQRNIVYRMWLKDCRVFVRILLNRACCFFSGFKRISR